MERWKAKVEICGGSRKAPDGEGREGEGGCGEWTGRRGGEGVKEEEGSRYSKGERRSRDAREGG